MLPQPVDFLGDDHWTMPSMIAVGVFVSLPFTIYVLLAGLSAISEDVLEAARIDGAGPWQLYRQVTLPLLRPALLVASVLNIIYVFNSFPIVYTLNDRNPGYAHDTSITFMYKLAFKSAEHSVGMSAAAGVFNVLLHPAGGAGLPAGGPLAGGRPMTLLSSSRTASDPAERGTAPVNRTTGWRRARRFVLPIAGLLVALVFLAPVPGDAAGRAAAELGRAGLAADAACPGSGSGTPSARCCLMTGS